MHMRDEQKGLLFLIVIILIIVVSCIIVGLSLRTDTVGESLENDQVIRVLYVMEDAPGNALMTEMVVYYPVSRKAAIVNIPANIGAIYSSLGRVDGISAIYKEKGIDVYKSEIENLLGTTIPFYTVVTLRDFVKLSDMMGGMRVFIPEPVDAVSDDGERWLLPSGAVTLDGDKVSVYLRYHLADENNSDVYERYQNVMIAFFTQLSDYKSVILGKKNFKSYSSLLSTNLNKKDFYRLMTLLSGMDTEYIIKQTVTGSARNVDGKIFVFPLNGGEFIKQAVAQSTNMLISTGSTMTSRIYVLDIQNGTNIQGLAHNTAVLFQNASYDILSSSNADRNDYEKTVIIDHIGNKEIAKMVGDFIHCTNIQEEEVKPDEAGTDTDAAAAANVDFTVILGKDFDGRYVRPTTK
ncbi:MAG: LCP family protein [Treponema sp.]|nr:LCP family protein [Treponema sp.]